jgi:hypothetical protein
VRFEICSKVLPCPCVLGLHVGPEPNL